MVQYVEIPTPRRPRVKVKYMTALSGFKNTINASPLSNLESN